MSDLSPDFFNRPLAEVDPEIADAIQHELERQQRTLEMIASENFVPQAVLECQGSVLTNKYAEGYPGKRYYGGCEYVDIVEQLAIDRAKALFGAEHANVQPHAGAQTNAAVYHALLQPGDTIMGLALPHGGHLTHGMKLNVSGRLYDIAPYEVSRETSLIDMDEVERIAHERKPKLILAGWSAYPRFLDFERFRAIADAVGAYLVVDMAHFAGLVAAGEHPNPVPVRRRRHLDGPQDARRRARRPDPVPRGARQGHQLGGLPRPAGRPARARHRRQGGGLPHRPDRALPRAPAAHRRRRQGAGRGAAAGRRRRQRAHRRHRRAPRSSSTCASPSSTASRPRTACTRSASPSTATRSPSIRARRWSPAACASARARWPPAACRSTTSTRSGASSPPRCRRTSRPARPIWPSASRRSPTATRSTSTSSTQAAAV